MLRTLAPQIDESLAKSGTVTGFRREGDRVVAVTLADGRSIAASEVDLPVPVDPSSAKCLPSIAST